ncbi:hypothetical protein BOX15_Mlig031163g1 [Macrostomum lignano]|uniref:Peptidyl-prolyl cis-trans isomerase n=1 Tax=Macrostomum lignano TaxID=282301 RepID=A0A267GXI0_9PLAT|nr:hypothetical protein BOX15_Mlig031163g2 [Macrostomum lignano]PAA75943.1 hypothetical protein BOX15_Mlig012324g1 [Macrostomum lignano]PAA90027.1 hypothetical protein BOX15_Mlig031163g1 [Macrostomum lignano]
MAKFCDALFALILVTFAAAVAASVSSEDSDEVAKPKYTVTEEVWFEIEIKDLDGPGDDFTGRFTVAVFGEDAPATSMNFASLARGWKSAKGDVLHYKNTPVHRVVPDFVVQMGDVVRKDGTGGASIFGKAFNDEPFILSHRSAGWVAMANHGPDTNGSQFYITLTKARWLDKHHVVFGKVVRGFDVVNTIGEVPTNPSNAQPKKRVRIMDCGVVGIKKPYTLSKSDLDSTADLVKSEL